MRTEENTPQLYAGQRLARFTRHARTMTLCATNDGGETLDLTAYEPGGSDRTLAAFQRTEEEGFIEEWTLGAYILGLQTGSKMREGITVAVEAAVAAIFDGVPPNPELEIELLIPVMASVPEQATA